MDKSRQAAQAGDGRAARLKRALKDNLAKRKAQAKARKDEPAADAGRAAPAPEEKGKVERDG